MDPIVSRVVECGTLVRVDSGVDMSQSRWTPFIDIGWIGLNCRHRMVRLSGTPFLDLAVNGSGFQVSDLALACCLGIEFDVQFTPWRGNFVPFISYLGAR